MLIINAKIATFDDKDTFIDNGFILIKDGTICNIGEMKNLKQEKSEELIDAKEKLIVPGFICAHTHIYSAFARGMILEGNTPSNFIEILKNLWWRLDKVLKYEDIYYSALTTLIECVKNGVTCIFDHHASPNCVEGSLDVIEEAFRRVGARGTLCYEVSDRDGEDIALKGIKENTRFISKTQKEKNDMIRGLFGLHASFTLSNKTLELASSTGNSLKAGFHIHTAEGIYDKEECNRNYNKSIIDRLNDFSVINNKSILAHCIHIEENDKVTLKKCNVVHNPESNMNNAVGYCDVLDLMGKGILIGLGSDGFSSNPFRAMDTCYILHKHEKKDPRVMTPYDVTNLAIKNNGKIASKFFNSKVGVIEKNAKADIIFLDYNSPTPVNKDNINGHIIFGMNSNLITDSIIDGKFIMKDRIITTLDENSIYSNSRKISKELWKRI